MYLFHLLERSLNSLEWFQENEVIIFWELGKFWTWSNDLFHRITIKCFMNWYTHHWVKFLKVFRIQNDWFIGKVNHSLNPNQDWWVTYISDSLSSVHVQNSHCKTDFYLTFYLSNVKWIEKSERKNGSWIN